MTRRIAATLLALHGLVHLIGFLVPWRIAEVESVAYRTTTFGGAIELGDVGARLVGVAWLALILVCIVAAYAVWNGRARAWSITVVAASVSLALCLVGMPDTIYGIMVNLVVLVVAWRYAGDRAAMLQPTR
jgi:small-conductance mechanosensitive channel